jgi:hypothetical protein
MILSLMRFLGSRSESRVGTASFTRRVLRRSLVDTASFTGRLSIVFIHVCAARIAPLFERSLVVVVLLVALAVGWALHSPVLAGALEGVHHGLHDLVFGVGGVVVVQPCAGDDDAVRLELL